MARIRPVEGVPIPPDGSAATMSTLFGVMARRPDIMQHAMQLLEAAMRTGAVEPELKELLAIRVSQVNYCLY